jgi:hypothetical protein
MARSLIIEITFDLNDNEAFQSLKSFSKLSKNVKACYSTIFKLKTSFSTNFDETYKPNTSPNFVSLSFFLPSLTPFMNDDSTFLPSKTFSLFSTPSGHLGLHFMPKKARIVIENWTMDQQSIEPGGSH